MSDAVKLDAPELNPLNMDVSDALKSADAKLAPTQLAAALLEEDPGLFLEPTAGRLTPRAFSTFDGEVEALIRGCGVYDLGWYSHIAVSGEDRLRWLSGMVTNAVQQLPEGQGNYSFLLNAQGRIQGDAWVYREPDRLLLAVESDQAEKVLAHLDRFIIMDDVTLESMDEQVAAIGLAGQQAGEVLARLGLADAELQEQARASMQQFTLHGLRSSVVRQKINATPRYEIWCTPADVRAMWRHLIEAGAQPCGFSAVEALRILEGIPRYGIDLNDRDLPQETSQMHALNFNKGCYLGQEIVERIRSRGAVHRSLRQFQLFGDVPTLPAELLSAGSAIGRLTSAVTVSPGGTHAMYALGIVRNDAIAQRSAITYNEGTAEPVDRPPAFLL